MRKSAVFSPSYFCRKGGVSMTTTGKKSRREEEYGSYVIREVAKILKEHKSSSLLIDCPSPGCLGMVRVMVDCSGERCYVTAHCQDSSPECDFPTLSGKFDWLCEGESE